MSTATEAMNEARERGDDEHTLHKRVQWFVEKWTTQMDLNKRDAAELNADLICVVQAVHRDASRETHHLLRTSLAAMPSPTFIVEKK